MKALVIAGILFVVIGVFSVVRSLSVSLSPQLGLGAMADGVSRTAAILVVVGLLLSAAGIVRIARR